MTVEEMRGDSPFNSPEWHSFLEEQAKNRGITFTEMMSRISSEEFEILANIYLIHIHKEKNV